MLKRETCKTIQSYMEKTRHTLRCDNITGNLGMKIQYGLEE